MCYDDGGQGRLSSVVRIPIHVPMLDFVLNPPPHRNNTARPLATFRDGVGRVGGHIGVHAFALHIFVLYKIVQ